MKDKPTIMYRDYAINFVDWGNDKFSVEADDKHFADLTKVCEHIDEIIKRENAFTRTKVFWEGWRDELKEGEATSVNDAGEVFVSSNNRREKLSSETKVFVDNPDNRSKYEQILAIRSEANSIHKQYQEKASDIVATMDRIGGKTDKEAK